MTNVLERAAARRLLITDSATGTWFQQRLGNSSGGEVCDHYNIAQPDVIRELYRAKISAGAELVLTNTFNSTPLRLREFNLEGEVDRLNETGVRLLKEVIGEGGRQVFVGGNVGPTGLVIGESATYDEVLESMRAQIRALVGAGIDILCVETIFQALEAQCAVEAAHEAFADMGARVPIYVTFAFMDRPKESAAAFRTFFGDTVREIMEGKYDELAKRTFEGAVRLGVNVVGANCSIGVEDAVAVTGEFNEYITGHGLTGHVFISAKPNSQVMSTMTYEDPAFAADRLERLVTAGAHFIGFCCGSTPEHIAAIARRRQRLGL